MTGWKSAVGIAALCALALSAFAANASAEQNAFYCADNAGSEDFSDSHCVTWVGSGNGSKGHEEFEPYTEYSVTATNAATASGTEVAAVSKLLGALSGVATEVQCTGLSGSGELINFLTSVETAGVISYSGCTVTKPSGKGCVVKGGAVTTNTLRATNFLQAANTLKFEPSELSALATVTIEKCSVGALNNSFSVTGSFVASVSGATTTTTHAAVTSQNTLKFGGVKAGIEGAMTIRWAGVVPVTLT
ncbi:MAG: hypothetical protein AB7V58_11105 [Solirubrobacterales bacterium]